MKKLSDYTNDEAIELWMDLLEPLGSILENENVRSAIASDKPRLIVAKEILRNCKAEAIEILTRIDPEPVDGLNIVIRLVALLADIGQHEELRSFFGFAEADKTGSESSISATENTEAEEI